MERGRCTEREVEEALSGRYAPLRTAETVRVHGEERFRFEGETAAGRFLVVIAARVEPGRFRPVTGWSLEAAALRSYLAWRRTVRR